MARASSTAENQSLNGLDATGTPVNLMAYVSLNTADPGTSGASESTFGRQACAWNAASGGNKTNSSALTFSGTSQSVSYFSTWSASTAGTYGIGGALTSSVTAASVTVAAGALTISSS